MKVISCSHDHSRAKKNQKDRKSLAPRPKERRRYVLSENTNSSPIRTGHVFSKRGGSPVVLLVHASCRTGRARGVQTLRVGYMQQNMHAGVLHHISHMWCKKLAPFNLCFRGCRCVTGSDRSSCGSLRGTPEVSKALGYAPHQPICTKCQRTTSIGTMGDNYQSLLHVS
jgi:hypothetical protein